MARWCFCLVFLLHGCNPVAEPAPEPRAVEERMEELKRRIAQSRKLSDWDRALALVAKMAALDGNHPKPFIELVLLQRTREALDEASLLMDSVGLDRNGPGRRYGEGMIAYFGQQPEVAGEAFAEALGLYEALGHLAGQAAAHTALGIVHADARRFDRSVAEYDSALVLLRQIDDQAGIVDVQSNLARVERRRGNLENALEEQRRILAERVELGDELGQAHSWYEISACLHRSGDPERAIPALERAIELYARFGAVRDRVSCLRRLATIQLDAGNGDQAIVLLREAVEASGAVSATLRAQTSRQLGDTLVETGRAGEGLALLETTASYLAEHGMTYEEIRTRTSIGHALSRSGELGRALDVLRPTLEAAESLADDGLMFGVATELGTVFLATGELTRALVLYERALESSRSVGNRDDERIGLNNLGTVYFALGEVSRSRNYIEESARLAVELNDREGVARAHNNLAVLLSDAGRPEEALSEAEEAIREWRSLGRTRGTAVGGLTLSAVLLRLGRVDEADDRIREAERGFRMVADRRGAAAAYGLLGEIRLAADDPQGAVAAHGQALELARQHDLPAARWRSHAGLAAALEASGQKDAALEHAMLALDEIERVRGRLEVDSFRMRFLDDRMRHYERAVALMLAGETTVGQVARSFEIAERAAARSLLELLTEAGAGLRDGIDPALRAREREALDELSAAEVRRAYVTDAASRAAARERVERAEQALERLEIRIRRSAPLYGEILYPRPATLEQISGETLGEDELLLRYLVGEERAWLWLVSREGAELFPLADPPEIAAGVASFLDAVESSAGGLTGRAPDEVAAARLAAIVLPPKPLPHGSRLLIAPDGPLHHIPFGALRPRDRFLIEDHEIVVVPSATILRLMRTRPNQADGVGFLGIADPVHGDGDERFPRLPYSRREVESIAELFPESEVTVLTGPAATKAGIRSLELDRFRFVHFATHGWLAPDALRHSGLRLSPTDGDEATALLSADEILAMRLSAEIVVLSACRSGQGELLRGEGLVSMTRAFLFAGARSVLVSLWNVDDVSTAAFMRSFYEELEAGEPPGVALRRTQLGFLGSDRPARGAIQSWASYVAVGNPGYPATVVNRSVARSTESQD